MSSPLKHSEPIQPSAATAFSILSDLTPVVAGDEGHPTDDTSGGAKVLSPGVLSKLYRYADLLTETAVRFRQGIEELDESGSMDFVRQKARFKSLGEHLSPNSSLFSDSLHSCRLALQYSYLWAFNIVFGQPQPRLYGDYASVTTSDIQMQTAVGDTFDWMVPKSGAVSSEGSEWVQKLDCVDS